MTTDVLASAFLKLTQLSWGIFLLIILISIVGWGLLISAGGGDVHIWTSKQVLRFGFGAVIMLALALMEPPPQVHNP